MENNASIALKLNKGDVQILVKLIDDSIFDHENSTYTDYDDEFIERLKEVKLFFS